MKEPHLIKIYSDFATLPMLQQLLHFCAHAEEENTTSISTWQRSPLKDGQQLLPNHIHIKQFVSPSLALIEKVIELNQRHEGNIELEIHANQAYQDRVLIPLVNMFHHLRYPIKKICLYEDGTGEYTYYYTKGLQGSQFDLDELTRALHANLFIEWLNLQPVRSLADIGIIGLLWHRIYPVEYHMLRPEMLRLWPALAKVYAECEPYVKSVDWSYFHHLKLHQQELMFAALGIKQQAVVDFITQHKKLVIFTGTTKAVSSATNLVAHEVTRMHRDIIKIMKKPESPIYISGKHTICYKGHPAGSYISNAILSNDKRLVEIPSSWPLEMLLMVGADIKYVCGMPSSAYLSLTPQQVPFVIIPPYSNESRHAALARPLAAVMYLTGAVEKDNILQYSELFKNGQINIHYWDQYTETSIDTALILRDATVGGSSLPEKKMMIGFYLAAAADYIAVEKSLDSLLRLGHQCVLVIDEHSPHVAGLAAYFETVARQDLVAFTITAIREAGVCFDCFVHHPQQAEVAGLGYHYAQYSEVGSIGTMPEVLLKIFNLTKKYRIFL
ncbi:MAG: hypothetical protein ACRDCQ_01070 [Aeromonas sobria]